MEEISKEDLESVQKLMDKIRSQRFKYSAKFITPEGDVVVCKDLDVKDIQKLLEEGDD